MVPASWQYHGIGSAMVHDPKVHPILEVAARHGPRAVPACSAWKRARRGGNPTPLVPSHVLRPGTGRGPHPMNRSAEHRLGSVEATVCQLAGAVPGAPIHGPWAVSRSARNTGLPWVSSPILTNPNGVVSSFCCWATTYFSTLSTS